MEQYLKKQIKIIKQALEMLTEPLLIAFMRGNLIALENVLKEWEKENEQVI